MTAVNKKYGLWILGLSCSLWACTGSVLGALPGGGGAPGAPGSVPNGPGMAGQEPGGFGVPSICTKDEPAPKRIWRLSREQYVNTLVATFGDTASAKSTLQLLPLEGLVEGYDNNAKSLFIGGELTSLVRAHAERLAPLNAESAVKANTCLRSTPVTDSCMNQVTLALGQRAFRRPLDSDEAQRYFEFVKAEAQASSVTTALDLYLQFLMRAPQFLYRSELGASAPTGGGVSSLTPFESAARLSYSLTDGPPDEALLSAAAAGKLETEAQRREQASRLLASPAGKVKLRDFVFQYLGVKSQQGTAPEKEVNVVPEFATAVYGDFVSETTQFVDDVIAQPVAQFDAFFTPTHTFVNDRLAQFYGLSTAPPKGFTKTDVSAAGRRGVLTQGLFLSTHAGSAATKHRHRANFIFRNMLCLDPGTPPPGATATGEAIAAAGPNRTKRDGYEHFLKVAGADCRGCHRRFEPIGLTFEKFDHFGRARDAENGFPIDTRSELVGAPEEFASFADPANFSNIFSRSAQAQNCFVQHAFTYALGRIPHPSKDGCALEGAQGQFRQDGLDFRKLTVDIAVSDALGQRQ